MIISDMSYQEFTDESTLVGGAVNIDAFLADYSRFNAGMINIQHGSTSGPLGASAGASVTKEYVSSMSWDVIGLGLHFT